MRPSITSYPSPQTQTIRGLTTSTFHGIFRKLLNIMLTHLSHCDFRYLDAVDSYSEISFTSPHTELLVFPRSKHGTTRYIPNLDSARLCQLASIVPACPRLLLFATLSAQQIYFLSQRFILSVTIRMRQLSTSILVSSPRALFSISQHGHRIRSALSSTK